MHAKYVFVAVEATEAEKPLVKTIVTLLRAGWRLEPEPPEHGPHDANPLMFYHLDVANRDEALKKLSESDVSPKTVFIVDGHCDAPAFKFPF